jgi:hypothetical protein
MIGPAGVERVQNAPENLVSRLDMGKRSGAGAELEVVGRTKDVAGGAIRMEQQGLTTFGQTRPENRVSKIGGGFILAFDDV